MTETDLARGDRTLRVRDAGDPEGRPVLYCHATPGSRLDMSFADDLATRLGVRLVSFDRPGYGGSSSAPFGFVSVAHDAAAVADSLGIDRFATLGQSGGGPFSLAVAAVLGERVTRAGVAAGGGPFDRVPDALASLDDNDTAAFALLPADPSGAARGFANGFEEFAAMFRAGSPTEIIANFHPMLSPRDIEIVADRRVAEELGASMKESLRQGTTGAGWDNVAWIGPWEIDPTTVSCPVLLWYGGDDRFCQPKHGIWLRDHLPDAHFVLRAGDGHFGFIEHAEEMLTTLTA